MFFASSIWLAVLLPPWAVVAAYVMWARRGRPANVPFLALWRGGAEESPPEKRHFRLPPVALVAALAAALLAVLSAARPTLHGAERGPHITIVLDRGLTMSAGPRRAEVLDAAGAAVNQAFGPGVASLVAVPEDRAAGAIETDRPGWVSLARELSPTRQVTGDAVRFAAARALAQTDGPVVVLSDQPLPDHPRLVPIAPMKALQNVGITRFAVRDSPHPAAMVTVSNMSSDHEQATLRVRSGERPLVERTVELPRRGGQTDVFFELPTLAAAAVAEIDLDGGGDDIAVDNVAHASRRRAFPAIEIRSPVPPEVRRVADVYARTRPPVEGSACVAVVSDATVAGDVPVAIVSIGTITDTVAAGAVKAAAHPVSAAVGWAEANVQPIDATPPGEGWRAVVSVGGRAAVLVREMPRRQVYIGFASPDFARTTDFVIFWTNVFEWLGGGGNGEEVESSGRWVSSIVGPVSIDPSPRPDWRAKLASLRAARSGGREITSAVLLGSMICLVIAAAAWPGQRLTPLLPPRTV